MIRLLIADDHQLFIDGLRSMLKNEAHIEVAAQAMNGAEVLARLSETPIDILLLDINMPNTDVVELTKEIRKQFPKTKIAILTMYHGTRYYIKLLKYKINGYLYKSIDKQYFLQAIDRIHQGGTVISEEIFADIPMTKETLAPTYSTRDTDPRSLLTKREMQVLKLITEQHSNSAIADTLCVSTGTVDTHRKNIILKLGVKNTVGLIKYCMQHNLFAQDEPE